MAFIRRTTGHPNVDRVIDDIYRILNQFNSVPNTGTVDTNSSITVEGGFAVRVTNGESFTLSKGSLVRSSDADNRTVILANENDYDIAGVVYDAIYSGSTGYVIVSGLVDVRFNANGSTRQNYFRMSKSGDTANPDHGKAQSDSINRIDSIRLLGYVLDNRSGEGLARCVLKR